MSRCVIISACPVSPELAEALRPDDFIIACDAGYRNCAPLGRRPNIIVGDFDTAPCPEQQDDDIIVLPHVKDDTDTEYAAKLVSEKGFDEVLLLGGLGGRRVEHIRALNARLRTGLAQYPKVRINSPDTAVPQILNLSVQNVKGTVFQRELESLGVNATVRRRLGSEISAACGQLRRDEMNGKA